MLGPLAELSPSSPHCSFARRYPTKSIFLRELLSNANDALEKLRLTSLQDHDTFIGVGELNITIRAEPDREEQGGVGRLIVKGEL
jgi:heat shock protein beta